MAPAHGSKDKHGKGHGSRQHSKARQGKTQQQTKSKRKKRKEKKKHQRAASLEDETASYKSTQAQEEGSGSRVCVCVDMIVYPSQCSFGGSSERRGSFAELLCHTIPASNYWVQLPGHHVVVLGHSRDDAVSEWGLETENFASNE